MFVGAYLGGNKSFMLDPALIKGSVLENKTVTDRSIIITIDGRQYEARIERTISSDPVFQY